MNGEISLPPDAQLLIVDEIENLLVPHPNESELKFGLAGPSSYLPGFSPLTQIKQDGTHSPDVARMNDVCFLHVMVWQTATADI